MSPASIAVFDAANGRVVLDLGALVPGDRRAIALTLHIPRGVPDGVELDITAHAHVFGRPYGAIEFRAAIEAVKDIDWVWMTTHEELAGTVYPQ